MSVIFSIQIYSDSSSSFTVVVVEVEVLNIQIRNTVKFTLHWFIQNQT